MLKLKRIKDAVEALEGSRRVLNDGIESKKLTKQDLKVIKANEKNFASKALPDYDKLVVYCDQKDPDTGNYVYKEKFRKEALALGPKLNELKDEINNTSKLIVKGEQIIIEREQEIKNQREKAKAIEFERKKEEEIKAKRLLEAAKEAKRLKEEEELAALKAKIAEESYSKNEVNRVYLGLKARVDSFLETVKTKAKTASLEEEINIAVGLLPEEKEKRQHLLKLLIKFYNNITRHPDKEEYRCFNLQNAKFQKDVLSFSGSLEIFVCGGFELLFSEVLDEETSEILKSITLKLEEPDIQNYDAWKAWFDTQKSVLQKLQALSLSIE